MDRPPEFTGQPLSMLMQVTQPKSDITLWQYGATFDDMVTSTPASIDQLVGNGYVQIPRQPRSYLLSHLFSQLCELKIAQKGEGYALTDDLEYVKKYPVTLACTLDIATDKNLYMLQFLPPPNIGEYGLINHGGDLVIYNIAQLPETAQKLWTDLTQALHKLVAPGGWIVYHPVQMYCTSELNYHRMVTDLRTAILKKRKNNHEAKQTLTALEEAHTHVNKLRQSWLQPDWILQWKEIVRMAQSLARDYYLYHTQVQKDAVLNTNSKPVPNIADVFNMKVADIPTGSPFQAYPAAAIAGPGQWQVAPAEKETEIILSYSRKKPGGTTYVQIREDISERAGEQVLANMWERTKQLSDLDADVYLAMLAQMLKGEKDEEGNTWITAQQILNYRGVLPKTNKDEYGHTWSGGHRWEKIEEIAACIERMENAWIKIQEMEIIDDSKPAKNKGKKTRTTISRESRLFMFGDVIKHNQLPLDGSHGKSIAIAWQYRQSSWMIPFLQGENRFTGLLFQKALEYDPYHEKWEKRLARHFTFWLRTNARHEKKPAILIGNLLKELNLEIDEDRPQRTRDRFEKAMKRLAADGLLTWDYKEMPTLPPRKWFTTWLQCQIIVEDPPYIKSQYMSIKAAAKVIREENQVTTQKRARKAKKTNGK